MYGKLNNGIIEYAPSRIELGRRIVFNPTATQLESVGYKEIKEGEQPEIKEGFHVIKTYA